MLRLWCTLLLILMFPFGASAQEKLFRFDAQTWKLQDGVTANNAGTTTLNVEGWGSAGVQVSGITDATVGIEATVDGTNWNALGCSKSNDGSLVSTTTTNLQWHCPIGNSKAIRAPITNYISGTITVQVKRTTAPLGSGGGGGGGGGSITNILDGTGDSIMNTALNAAQVSCVAGCGGSGGTSMADDAAFSPAVTNVSPAGFMFDDVAPDSVNEGDGGVARMSANRNIYTTIRDAAGNERGVNVTAGNALTVDGSATTQPVSGTVTANAGTNLNTSLLLTTTAHDAAFGTAGSADTQVRTVQGIASMTPLQVQSNSANLATQTTVATLLTESAFTTVMGGTDTVFGSAGTADADVMTVQGIASMTPLQVQSNSANLATQTTVATLLTESAFTTVMGGTDTVFGTAGSADNDVMSVQGIASMTPFLVTGNTAHDAAAASVNPLLTGCYGSAAAPTDVSATNDAVREWCLLNGARAITITQGGLFGTVRDTGSNDSLNVSIVDASGNQITTFGGGTQYAEGATAATITGTAIMFESNTGTNTLSVVNSTTPLPVTITSTSVGTASDTEDGSVNGGAANVAQVITHNYLYDTGGAAWGRASTNNGTVNGTTLRVTVASDSTGTTAVTQATASNLNAQVVGTIAHDSPDSGNPVKIGGKAYSSAPSVTANDRVDAYFDLAGRLHTVCDTGCGGSGGTAQADKSAFTEGTTTATPIMGVYNQSLGADPSEDQAAAARITAKRAIHTSPYTPNGDSMSDDTNDAIRVNVVAGAAGGTAMTDDAAFTVATTTFTPSGGTYRSVRDAVDDNDGGAFAMTQKRALYSSLETPNGDSAMDDTNDSVKVTLAGTNSLTVVQSSASSLNAAVVGSVAHDGAASSVPPLTIGGYASAAAPADVSADNDAVRGWFLRNGAQATVLTAAGALIGGDATNGLDVDVTRIQGTVTVSVTGSATVDSELPAAAALADAASATPSTVTVGAVPMLMNATTVDRARAVVNALDSTGTGIAAAGLIAQLDDVSTGTVTENQFAPVRQSSRRALLIEGVASGNAVTISGNVSPATAANWGVYVEDAAETGGGNLMMAGAVRRDAIASSSTSSGDNSTFNTNDVGALWVAQVPATNGGTTPCYITSAASTNATNCKNAAGQLYGFDLVNTTTTIYYLRLYNLSTSPTCSSATGFVRTIPVPPAAATGGAGGITRSIEAGEAYGTGIGFCLTGGGSSTDNTNAATGVYVTLNYK